MSTTDSLSPAGWMIVLVALMAVVAGCGQTSDPTEGAVAVLQDLALGCEDAADPERQRLMDELVEVSTCALFVDGQPLVATIAGGGGDVDIDKLLLGVDGFDAAATVGDGVVLLQGPGSLAGEVAHLIADRSDGEAVAWDEASLEFTVGQCIDLPGGSQVSEYVDVDCALPHDAEVYALFDTTGTSFPGQATLEETADTGCKDRFEDYVGRAYEDSVIFSTALTPSRQSWEDAQDREIVCLLVGAPLGGGNFEQLIGSKEGSGQ